MTRKKSNAKRETPKELPFGQIQFVLNNLSQAELDDMDTREDMSPDHVMLRLSELIEGGWKLSTKWDYKSSAIQATLMMVVADHPNAGFALSARSDDLLDAYKIVVYKHDIVAGGNLSEFSVDVNHVRG